VWRIPADHITITQRLLVNLKKETLELKFKRHENLPRKITYGNGSLTMRPMDRSQSTFDAAGGLEDHMLIGWWKKKARIWLDPGPLRSCPKEFPIDLNPAQWFWLFTAITLAGLSSMKDARERILSCWTISYVTPYITKTISLKSPLSWIDPLFFLFSFFFFFFFKNAQ
jgi:hypothetical protein